jgi:hypothetical protein
MSAKTVLMHLGDQNHVIFDKIKVSVGITRKLLKKKSSRRDLHAPAPLFRPLDQKIVQIYTCMKHTAGIICIWPRMTLSIPNVSQETTSALIQNRHPNSESIPMPLDQPPCDPQRVLPNHHLTGKSSSCRFHPLSETLGHLRSSQTPAQQL